MNIAAICNLAREMGMDTFTLYNYIVELKPSVERTKAVLSKMERIEDQDKPVFYADTADITKKSSTRKGNRKLTLKDKAKAGSNKWHHIDKMAESHPVYGLKRIQDLRMEEKEKMEKTEAMYEDKTFLGDTLNDALWAFNPYIYRSVEGYVADVLNAVAEVVDLTADIIEYVNSYAVNEYNAAIEKRDRYLQCEKHILWEIEDTEVQLDNLLRELDETREELALMF